MKRIVAFTGLAGSGKSTAAAYLATLGYTRTRFAAPLKAMLRALYVNVGLEDAEIDRRIEGDLKEAPDPLLAGRTPRYAMQTIGTEWGRDLIGYNFWVDLWAARVAGEGKFVVEDCRFANEATAVANAGGIIIRVNAPWAGSASGAGHSSEGLNVIPHAVVENSDWDDLRPLHAQIDAILSRA